MPSFYSSTDTDQRRWRFRLLLLLLGGAFLMGCVWLYYDYRVRQLEQQLHQLLNATSNGTTPS